MGFEPTTFSLARRRSTTELHPRKHEDIVKPVGSQAGPARHTVWPTRVGADTGHAHLVPGRSCPGELTE